MSKTTIARSPKSRGVEMRVREGTIKVGQDFPLKPGEVLRILLGGTRELRVKITGNVDNGNKHANEFGTQIYYHHVGTNKDQISMVGNERKLKRV